MADLTQAPKMNADSLWREEVFTDREVGVIRRMAPVKADGTPDLSRKAVFTGEATLMTPAGSLPLAFDIPADDLEQAVARYGDALETAYQRALDELRELQRRASSKIVLPQGGLPPGGLSSAAGKLKL